MKTLVVRIVMPLVLIGCSVTFVSSQSPDAFKPSRVEDGPPQWLKDFEFKKDDFTFVRLRYDRPIGRWSTDYPDADLNFSNRLRQLTSLDVSPEGVVLEITDPHLTDFPFAYLSSNGNWQLDDNQIDALRAYLDGGGFLLIDDLWGANEWDNAREQVRRVLPGYQMSNLPLTHPIFHCVYDLQEKPQVCGVYYALEGRNAGITWERPDSREASYYGITDETGRLLVLICRNTDLADGWERVNDDAWYAQEFSEKRAFPMGVNIVFHVLNH